MPDPMPTFDELAAAERIDAVADQFEAAWKAQRPPSIDEFLPIVPEAERTALAAELRKIDRAYRQKLTASVSTESSSTGTLDSNSEKAATADWPWLDGFHIEAELGHGGMGVVYRARQQSLARTVAIKMLRVGAHADAKQRQRFLAESNAVARLQHPNIVQIHQVGEAGGRAYFVLEFMEGGSLARALDGQPKSPRAAAELVETLAIAMQYAHEQGIVHRDLKPANILLRIAARRLQIADSPGRAVVFESAICNLQSAIPKISDFGIAKRLDDTPDGPTQTGEVLGTPSYMAPEQAEGKLDAIGPAADIYALGAILYEMLTGRPPFRGASTLETLEQVRTQEPVPPRRLQSRVPRDLETICQKALAKVPARRYGTARDLADDLRRFLAGQPIRARSITSLERAGRWCRRNPVVSILAASTLTFLLLGITISIYFAVKERIRAGEAEAATKQAKREAALSARERGMQAAQQGQGGRGLLWLVRSLELAEEAGAADLGRVIRANLSAVAGRLNQLRLTIDTGGTEAHCVLTPDGSGVWVSNPGSRDVRRWDVANGKPGPVLDLDLPRSSGLALSPVGAMLFTGGDTQSWLWDARTQNRRAPPLRHSTNAISAAFSPDSQVLLTGHQAGVARLWDTATGALRAEMAAGQGALLGVAFSPDGNSCATGSVDDVLRLWDVATGKPKGDPIPFRGEVYALAWSPDNRTLAVGNAHGVAKFWDLTASQWRPQILVHHSTVTSIAFSRDGRIIATGSGDRTVRLWDAETLQPIDNLLPHREGLRSVSFSADGRTLATAGFGGQVRVWNLAPRGIEIRHRTWVYSGVFSPDGGTILTGCGDHRAQLWDAATGAARGDPLEHANGVHAVAFRSDGRSFVTGCGNGEVYTWNVGRKGFSGVNRAHQQIVYALALSPDDRTLVTGSNDRTARLWDATTGQPRGEPLQHDGPVRCVAFSPDGRTTLTGGDDQLVRAWNAANGAPLGPPLALGAEVIAMAYSRDGASFFTADRGRRLRRWDAQTREPFGNALTLEREVTCLAVSPDGQSVLLGSSDGTVQLVDVATSLTLANPFPHGKHVLSVAFSPDGRKALSTAQDPWARVWAIPAPVSGDLTRIRTWAQTITGLELTSDGQLTVLDATAWKLLQP